MSEDQTPQQLSVIEAEAPLIHLINQDLDKMSDAQLLDHIAELRVVRQSTPTFKAKVTRPKKTGYDISNLL